MGNPPGLDQLAQVEPGQPLDGIMGENHPRIRLGKGFGQQTIELIDRYTGLQPSANNSLITPML